MNRKVQRLKSVRYNNAFDALEVAMWVEPTFPHNRWWVFYKHYPCSGPTVALLAPWHNSERWGL
mgnify:CR=1 FL=1